MFRSLRLSQQILKLEDELAGAVVTGWDEVCG